MNQSEVKANTCSWRKNAVKRGKTRATKLQLVLVLLLIGQENGAKFSNAKSKQSRNYFRHSTGTADTLNEVLLMYFFT